MNPEIHKINLTLDCQASGVYASLLGLCGMCLGSRFDYLFRIGAKEYLEFHKSLLFVQVYGVVHSFFQHLNLDNPYIRKFMNEVFNYCIPTPTNVLFNRHILPYSLCLFYASVIVLSISSMDLLLEQIQKRTKE